MELLLDHLQAICVTAEGRKRAVDFIAPLQRLCPKYGIDTLPRLAAFLAQIMHESGEFRYVRELASGAAYEGRKDLGNTHPGDGKRYKGRGLIQITGRSNYDLCGRALGADLISFPEQLEEPALAVESACWFWKSRGLSELADAGKFETITRRINGGTNGLDDRLKYWRRAQQFIAPHSTATA
jgi:putative chitinase